MIIVSAITCHKCGATIYSRCGHDMRWCTCKSIAIDGGRDYSRVVFEDAAGYTSLKLTVDATQAELFQDWNSYRNKFGLIFPESSPLDRTEPATPPATDGKPKKARRPRAKGASKA
jgi:hypothetical protein